MYASVFISLNALLNLNRLSVVSCIINLIIVFQELIQLSLVTQLHDDIVFQLPLNTVSNLLLHVSIYAMLFVNLVGFKGSYFRRGTLD